MVFPVRTSHWIITATPFQSQAWYVFLLPVLLELSLTSHLCPGEFESTMTMSFLRATKLRRWLSRPDCPEVVHICKEYFDKAFTPSSTLHKSTTLVSMRPVDVPDELCLLIGKRKATLQAYVHYDGATYSWSSTHLGNSLILFYPNGDFTVKPVPASITYIYHERNSIRLAVQRQNRLPSTFPDPF